MMLIMDLPFWILSLYVFVIGAVIGSFLNVCVYRIPQYNRLWGQLRSLSEKPSHCPRCQTHIRWYDNVPIFGWLKLRGRCRSCRMWISARYPIVEFLNGSLLLLLFLCICGGILFILSRVEGCQTKTHSMFRRIEF